MNIRELYTRICEQIGRVIVGQEDVVELSLAALLSNGHVLLEGAPGVAKTMLVRTIARTLSMRFGRLQMTPDLLPADIAGSSIWREQLGIFEFVPGPVFANFLLADEINRASARTQSALLEAMQEMTVTCDGRSHPLPSPFIVFATQNPVEQEGTYPLPLAQLDRFMFKVIVGYPDGEQEERILREHHANDPNQQTMLEKVEAIVAPELVLEAQSEIRRTFVRDELINYVRRLVHATREHDALMVGASPRAGLMLLMAAKCLARFADHEFVTPDDVQQAFKPCMRHRVMLSPTSELEGVSEDTVLESIMDEVEVPR